VGLLLKRCENLHEFLESVRLAECMDVDMRQRLCREIVLIARQMRPKIVVNKVTNAYEAKIASNILAKYARHLLYMEPEYLGHLFFDKCVSEAVNSGLPFVVGRPRQKVSGCIVDMANRLGYF
jgi:MinD-like ATPase involved in chromosome partitioning or flagellar assembly